MTSHRADDLNGRLKEADPALGDNDDLDREGEEGRVTSTVHAVVDEDRWHYYHLSTP